MFDRIVVTKACGEMETIVWGDTTVPVTHSYPNYEDMHELSNHESLTLETVKFKVEDIDRL